MTDTTTAKIKVTVYAYVTPPVELEIDRANARADAIMTQISNNLLDRLDDDSEPIGGHGPMNDESLIDPAYAPPATSTSSHNHLPFDLSAYVLPDTSATPAADNLTALVPLRRADLDRRHHQELDQALTVAEQAQEEAQTLKSEVHMALCERKRLQDELKRERKEKKELKAREKRQKEERERDQQERWKLMLEEVNREWKAALEERETKWTAKLEETKKEQEKKWKATIEETKKEQERENERWREEENKWKATIQATVQHLVNEDVEALDKIRLRNLLNRAQEKILVECGLVHESASPETFRSKWQAIFQGVRSNRAQHLRAYFKSTNAPKSVLALLASDETLALLAEEDPTTRMERNLAAHPAITARCPYEEVIGRALEARDAFTQLLDYII